MLFVVHLKMSTPSKKIYIQSSFFSQPLCVQIKTSPEPATIVLFSIYYPQDASFKCFSKALHEKPLESTSGSFNIK